MKIISLAINRCMSSKYMIVWVLILGLVLRLVVINQSLWLDEAIGAVAVKNYSYKGIVSVFLKNDNHPPLYYLTLKFWTDIFGYSELAMRSLSVIFGVGTIFLTYKIAQKVSTNRLFAPLAVLLITTSQLHIYYSQEARMYSMAAFVAALSIYYFLDLIKNGKSKQFRTWFIFSLTQTALVFVDYIPVFLLPAFWLFALMMRKSKVWWYKFLLLYIPLCIFGLIWFPTFMVQSEGGRWLLSILPAWKNIAGGATVKQALLVWIKFVLGRVSLANKIVYAIFIIAASIPILLTFVKALVSRKKIGMIWLWFIVPLVLGYITSYFFPAFIYFRFLYVLPAFYLVVAWGAIHIRGKLTQGIVIVALIIFNLVSWVYYIVDKKQQREEWRQATLYVEEQATGGDIVLFDYPEPITPYRWYTTGQVNSFGATNSISADPKSTEAITKGLIADVHGVFYFEYLRDLSDPGHVVEKTLTQSGFNVKNVQNFVGVGQVFYYSR